MRGRKRRRSSTRHARIPACEQKIQEKINSFSGKRLEFHAYIDGSFDDVRKIGGWGLVIVSDGKSHLHSGALRSCNSSTDAETKAATQALCKLESVLSTPDTDFIIFTDCAHVERLFKVAKSGQKGTYVEYILNQISRVPESSSLSVTLHKRNHNIYSQTADSLAYSAKSKLFEELFGSGKIGVMA